MRQPLLIIYFLFVIVNIKTNKINPKKMKKTLHFGKRCIIIELSLFSYGWSLP